jgi:aspartyl-tRNA synthetase
MYLMERAVKFLKDLKRTNYCGELRAEHAGREVTLMGWVDTRRDHGGLVFVDLRDRSGLVQVVLNPNEAATATSKDFRGEYVVALQGVVRLRPQGMENKKLPSGAVEVEAKRCEILSEAKTPPFQVDDPKVGETLRLKYRYLELRSNRLQSHLITRHKVAQIARNFLSKAGFVEVETPILYKSTPEGARDYLVPSRVNLGMFYALPQSPQTLKQLLMIGGMDRYFQLCRCFRDEDLRADRQPEFSQIDIEMSFVEQDDVMAINEQMLRSFWKEVKGVDVGPLPVLSYSEVMNRFGSDKPDLRNPLELKDVGAVLEGSGFKVFDDVLARGGAIKALAVPGAGAISRGQIDKLTTMSKQYGAKGLVWIKSEGGVLTSPASKFVGDERLKKLFQAAGAKEGDAAFVVADDFDVTCAALGALRNHLGHEYKLVDTAKDAFLWVVDFPLLEYDAESKRWAARHHPFTMVQDHQLPILMEGREKEYGKLLAKAYDLVCNGYEMGGGSVRIHRQEVQAAMFTALGLTPEETKLKFGFFIEALQYGTPPHAGIAWGLDRLVMLLCGTDAIRDVIAFPKTARATDLMAEAPSPVERAQLLELGIRLGAQAEKNLSTQSEMPEAH